MPVVLRNDGSQPPHGSARVQDTREYKYQNVLSFSENIINTQSDGCRIQGLDGKNSNYEYIF